MKIVISFLILSLSHVNVSIAAEAGMPQLDPTYWASQAFWLIIIFSLIYFSISKIFIPKIKNNIDNRENKIRKDLEEASNLKEEADKKFKLYNESIAQAKIEAQKIISESSQKLNEDIQSKKNQIEKEIEKEILNAEKEIQNFKKNSLSKINLISEDVVSNLIKDIFGEEINSSSIKASVAETLKKDKTI